MNQQEFDIKCVQLEALKQRLLHDIRKERESDQHKHKKLLAKIAQTPTTDIKQSVKDEIVTMLQDAYHERERIRKDREMEVVQEYAKAKTETIKEHNEWLSGRTSNRETLKAMMKEILASQDTKSDSQTKE